MLLPQNMSVSATMKRLVLVEASGDDLTDAKLELEECPTPTPKATEVLVKVAAAPINPSDYGSWRSKRGDGPVPTFDFTYHHWPSGAEAFAYNTDPSPTRQFMLLNPDHPSVQPVYDGHVALRKA